MAASAVSDHDVARSFATIREMLTDRGCDVASLATISVQDVVERSANKSVFSVDVPSCSVRVIFNMHVKFKMADIRKLLDDTFATYIVVVREKPSTALKGEAVVSRDVSFFHIKELQFNLSRHMLVPRHEPMRNDGDIEEVMQRYRLKSRLQLPLILTSDPMARYLALKPGQLVRITRTSPSGGTYVLYRCCQKG